MDKKKSFLILDHELYNAEAHSLVTEFAQGKGFEVTYRRYFPHFTPDDMDNGVVMIYAGRMPSTPGARMSSKELEPLKEYVLGGGVLVLCHGGVARQLAREHERYLFNCLLEELDAPIRINKDIVVKDSKVKYGASATNGLAIPPVVLEKEADDQYIYAWTGKWVLANRQNYVVSLNSFSVPAGTPDALDGSAEVRLIPKYDRQLRVYELKVTIIYPDDNNNICMFQYFCPDGVHPHSSQNTDNPNEAKGLDWLADIYASELRDLIR